MDRALCTRLICLRIIGAPRISLNTFPGRRVEETRACKHGKDHVPSHLRVVRLEGLLQQSAIPPVRRWCRLQNRHIRSGVIERDPCELTICAKGLEYSCVILPSRCTRPPGGDGISSGVVGQKVPSTRSRRPASRGRSPNGPSRDRTVPPSAGRSERSTRSNTSSTGIFGQHTRGGIDPGVSLLPGVHRLELASVPTKRQSPQDPFERAAGIR